MIQLRINTVHLWMINMIYNYYISFYCSFVIREGLYLETRLLQTVNVLPPDQLMSCSLYRHKLIHVRFIVRNILGSFHLASHLRNCQLESDVCQNLSVICSITCM